MSSQPLGDIPGRHLVQNTAIAHAAATATEYVALLSMPFDCKVREVGVIPAAAVTGADTNETNLNVVNLAAGAGSTEVGNYDLVLGKDLAAVTRKVIATGLSVAMSEGHTLGLQAEKVGNGLAVPAGTFYAIIDGTN